MAACYAVDMQRHAHKTRCRICEGSNLVKVLDLGSTPPANAYVKKRNLNRREESFPLALYFCKDCTLAQLLDVVHPEILFKNYHFITGASAPSVEHFKQYADEVVRPLVTSKHNLVIDIGGNDGVLLSFVKNYARVLNVDPANNLAPLSEQKGVAFYPAFFNTKVAGEVEKKFGKATVITANNVFAHTDPLRDVFLGVEKLLADEGTFVFEVHWVKHLLEEGCFDQIYHEHLCFHSLHALKRLVESTGMSIYDVTIVPTQGESLRVFVSKHRKPTRAVSRILEIEVQRGIPRVSTYRVFAKKVESNKKGLIKLLRDLKATGKIIAGYGAPAKGNTLLNYYNIGPETLEYLTDTTPLKQGLYSPGMHIPIVHPDRLQSHTPDYVFLLAWNFKKAILEKEKTLRKKGVKFIVSVPTLQIL